MQGLDGGDSSTRNLFGRPLGSPASTGGFGSFTPAGNLGCTSMAGETSQHCECHQQLWLLAPSQQSAPPVAQPSLPMHDHCSGSGI